MYFFSTKIDPPIMRTLIVLAFLVAYMLDQTEASTEAVKARMSAFRKGINKLVIAKDVKKLGAYISKLNEKNRFELTGSVGFRLLYDWLNEPNLDLDIYGAGMVPDPEKRANIESACEKLVSEGQKVEQDTNFDQTVDREIRKTFNGRFSGLGWSWAVLRYKLGHYRACRRFLDYLKKE